MFYTIYKITNKINNKIYIGKHQTKELNDDYMGSGKHLKYAINKYGIENFIKEILFQFDNETDMNAKESELVTEEFVKKDTNYNLCPGGQGGWGYINTSEELKKIASTNRLISQRDFFINTYGVDHISKTPNCRKIISERNKNLHKNGILKPPSFLGKLHTEESKSKISEKAKMRTTNSQSGTMWITNGYVNKKIKKDIDFIPEGWYKGRVIKNNAVTSVSGSIHHCD